MASTKIKLTWANPQLENTRWRLGTLAIHQRDPSALFDLKDLSDRARTLYLQRTVHISIRGALVWLTMLGCAGYLAVAYAIFHVQSGNPHNRISYRDVALPWRWSSLKVLRGEALIAQARDEIKARQFAAGFSRLRAGLARNPTDSVARLELSQLFIVSRLRTRSDDILIEAFEHGYPGNEYVEKAYRVLTYGDVPHKEILFLEAARAASTKAGGSQKATRTIEALEIESLLRMERWDEAGGVSERLYPENSDRRIEVDVAVALGRRDLDRAANLVTSWFEQRPLSEEVLARAAGVYRQSGRFDDMQACIDRLRKISPTNPAHATFNVVQNILAGRDTIARAALADGLFRFGSDDRELAIWARDIAEIGRDDFLVLVERFMHEQGHGLRPVLFARLLAQIRSRDWAAAQTTVARLREREAQMAAGERQYVKVLTSLAIACTDAGGGAQQMFIDAYQRSPVSLEFSRLIVEALLDADRPATASQVVTLAEGVYPESRYLLGVSKRVGESLLAHDKMQEKSRPAAAASPMDQFGDHGSFMAELRRLEAGGQADEGLRLIRSARKRPPAWLVENEEPVIFIELELTVLAKDLSLLRLTARNYLRSAGDTGAQALITLGTTWHQRGLKTEPLLVVREILKQQPDFEPALQVLERWDPQPLPVMDEAPSGGAPK